MALKEQKQVETNRSELTITIDAKTFSDAVDKAAAKGSKKVTVPGFRKGHAPRSIIEKMYGEEFFYEDALNLLYSDTVDEAIEASGLELAENKTDFELVSIGKDGVEFKVTVTTKPEVTLGEYKGLKAERPLVEINDEEVSEEIEKMRNRGARTITVEDRPAQMGDMTVIDFDGYLDGKQFEGGKAEKFSLELGSGQFIPGFEEQVAGHNTGDEFDVNVTFPADYHAEDLAGKPVVFKVKLHEISSRELPKVDDEFAKDVSEFDTLEALENDIKEKILKSKNEHADAAVEKQLIDQIIEGMTAEIPECMIEAKVDENIREFEYRLQQQGMDLKTYLQYLGNDMEGFRKGFKDGALNQVKIRLAVEAIAKAEKIEATEDEFAAEIQKIADAYQVEAEKIRSALPEKEIKLDIACNKAIDLIKNSASVTDAKPEKKADSSSKAAPKKAPAKKTGEKAE